MPKRGIQDTYVKRTILLMDRLADLEEAAHGFAADTARSRRYAREQLTKAAIAFAAAARTFGTFGTGSDS